METKKKFEKNIFTEVLAEKPQDQQTSSTNKNQPETNHEPKKESESSNKQETISPKNLRKIKKIKKICSQNFIPIEELKNVCW